MGGEEEEGLRRIIGAGSYAGFKVNGAATGGRDRGGNARQESSDSSEAGCELLCRALAGKG